MKIASCNPLQCYSWTSSTAHLCSFSGYMHRPAEHEIVTSSLYTLMPTDTHAAFLLSGNKTKEAATWSAFSKWILCPSKRRKSCYCLHIYCKSMLLELVWGISATAHPASILSTPHCVKRLSVSLLSWPGQIVLWLAGVEWIWWGLVTEAFHGSCQRRAFISHE